MSNRRHHRSTDSYGTKVKRDKEKRIKKEKERGPVKTSFESKRSDLVPEHYLAKEYNCTWHAVVRYAERIFGMSNYKARRLDPTQSEQIAKSIRESLPKILINETKYNLVDNYYAVVNNNMIITIVKIGL